jgi:hypothetical protein
MQSRLSFVHAIDKKITKIYLTYTDLCFCLTLFVGSMRTVYFRAQSDYSRPPCFFFFFLILSAQSLMAFSWQFPLPT